MATKAQLKDLAMDCVKLSVDLQVAGFSDNGYTIWTWATAFFERYKKVMLAEAEAKLVKK